MRIITKKAYTEYFEKVCNGQKKFDLRVADFECREGDILELVEIDQSGTVTGRKLQRRIGTVLRTKDVNWYDAADVEKYGFVVMSLDDEN